MDFSSLLNTTAADIEKPPVLPQGTYLWKVNKAHKEADAGKGEWKIVEIPVVAVSPDSLADDVDLDALSEFGSLNASTNSIRFMFPTDPSKKADVDRTLYSLKKFLLDVLHVDAEPEATLKELLAKAIGCEFRAQAIHRFDAERDTTFVDVKNYMAAE